VTPFPRAKLLLSSSTSSSLMWTATARSLRPSSRTAARRAWCKRRQPPARRSHPGLRPQWARNQRAIRPRSNSDDGLGTLEPGHRRASFFVAVADGHLAESTGRGKIRTGWGASAHARTLDDCAGGTGAGSACQIPGRRIGRRHSSIRIAPRRMDLRRPKPAASRPPRLQGAQENVAG
jgi:hypothetical protein